MLRINILRHGKTQGNLERRYIGTTDEPLCQVGRNEAQQKAAQLAAVASRTIALYSSPMHRCLETASILFPQLEAVVVDDLRESSFGQFENKNYQELQDNPAYRAWLDSNGELPFPDGESKAAVSRRVLTAFDQVIEQALEDGHEEIVLVVHGGTIMTIMAAYGCPARPFYDWQTGNLNGYVVTVNPAEWPQSKKLYVEQTI